MSELKIAAMADIHIGRMGFTHKDTFKTISEIADILVLCGDLTDRGTVEQTNLLIDELQSCTIPIVAVLGNHDYDAGKEKTIIKMLTQAHVSVLDGEYTIVKDIGFAGIKGFCGGFNEHIMTPFGEHEVKDFVKVSIDESLALERALSQLPTQKKIVLMHYAPIPETVRGEPKELFPFLGSSHLLSPLNRFKVDTIFHGHAHHGTAKGKTEQGIPVYNVSYPLLKKETPEKPYTILSISIT